MKRSPTIIIVATAALVIGTAVTHAILQRKKANSDPPFVAISAAEDSSVSTLHDRAFASDTTRPEKNGVVSALKDSAIKRPATNDHYVPAPAKNKRVYSGPISLSNISDKTISGDSINSRGQSINQIMLNNCSNIHLTKLYLTNTQGMSIRLMNCKNITIDSCFLSNMAVGVYAENCHTIKVNANQGLNLNNNGQTGYLAHFVQFNNVTGGGNQINFNRVENIADQAINPHDILNVYKSSGLKGDSIQVVGNWIRGGQLALNAKGDNGAAGIVVGDLGGDYQVCRNNVLVNPGYVGIQAQGGNHIKVDHNLIYSDSTPASLVGMSWGNFSGTSASDITYAYNKVKWFSFRRKEDDFGQHDQTVVLIGNNWGADINAGILPKVIITIR